MHVKNETSCETRWDYFCKFMHFNFLKQTEEVKTSEHDDMYDTKYTDEEEKMHKFTKITPPCQGNA